MNHTPGQLGFFDFLLRGFMGRDFSGFFVLISFSSLLGCLRKRLIP